jgi:acetylornithine deacetylase/succinyl-diaminopimelate desuccinylase-like protein
MTQTTLDYLAAQHDRILAELIEFAAIPSVSTDPAHRADIDRAAAWVAGQVAAAGPFDVRIIPTGGHPVVFAQWLGAAGKPTILIYGHYDVQPPDPLEKWISPPFTPTVRTVSAGAGLPTVPPTPAAGAGLLTVPPGGEARLYARGVSDDKGPIFQAIKVAQAFFATQGRLPVNIKFIFEGEEEIGSPSLEPFIVSHTDLLAADFVISADGGMWRIQEPSVTISSRGLSGLEFSLTGAAKDLHSGRHGGAVANPLHAIAELVASLHAADGRVAVAGFYDDVIELPAEERAAIAALPFDEAEYLAEIGAPAPVGEPGYSTLERQWTRPTLEINGMWGGYQGPGTKTVTPSEAHAKITCRLVPNQAPADIAAKIAHHLAAHLPPGVSLAIHPEAHGAQPYRIPADHFGLKTAAAALSQTFGAEPLTVRMGGTVPVCEVFKRVMGLDTVFFSFSTADEDFHAPNEFFRVHRLYEGLEGWARYWELLGQQK